MTTHCTTATVRMFGLLHTLRRRHGLPPEARVPVPPGGRTALDIARDLELPVEAIEAVFVNHRAVALDHEVRPGDTVAFVPRGTPGPHRFTLGIFHAGKGATGAGQRLETRD